MFQSALRWRYVCCARDDFLLRNTVSLQPIDFTTKESFILKNILSKNVDFVLVKLPRIIANLN